MFERLGIKPKLVYVEQRIALEKMKERRDRCRDCRSAASRTRAVSQFKDDRFHLVPVDYAKPLQGDYLPASLSAKDYPNLISDQEQVDTIAVPAVLAAYNWAPNTERYRKLALFVDNFFTKFPTFQNPRRSTPSGRRSRCRLRYLTGSASRQRSNGSTNTGSSPWRAAGSTNS